MTLPDVHLAEEALAAYVDGVLSPAADDRAERHLRGCAECRAAVEAQREAKALMAAAPDPELPAGLLAKLLDVPMTADLGGGDWVLAVAGDEFGWATGLAERPEDPRLVERTRSAAPSGPGAAPSGRRSGCRGAARRCVRSGPAAAAAGDGRPRCRPGPPPSPRAGDVAGRAGVRGDGVGRVHHRAGGRGAAAHRGRLGVVPGSVGGQPEPAAGHEHAALQPAGQRRAGADRPRRSLSSSRCPPLHYPRGPARAAGDGDLTGT